MNFFILYLTFTFTDGTALTTTYNENGAVHEYTSYSSCVADAALFEKAYFSIKAKHNEPLHSSALQAVCRPENKT